MTSRVEAMTTEMGRPWGRVGLLLLSVLFVVALAACGGDASAGIPTANDGQGVPVQPAGNPSDPNSNSPSTSRVSCAEAVAARLTSNRLVRPAMVSRRIIVLPGFILSCLLNSKKCLAVTHRFVRER
jgi:hypothetical protein